MAIVLKLTICKPIKKYPIDRNVMGNLKPGEQVTKFYSVSQAGRDWGVGRRVATAARKKYSKRFL